MLVKTSELTGPALDWAVAKCEAVEVEYINDGITQCLLQVSPFTGRYSPSTNWSQGGPIIERVGIAIARGKAIKSWHWVAGLALPSKSPSWGDTPLIAAMRCYVASKLGESVDIPDELVNV